ncbi:CU044_2847 family protein [Streptomyces liangshanensis]|uniref:CU044_2847 family protein n=1 Tax=Streptomyces liangshanensis TaxID=2717324 RepID=UPI0036D80B12
MELTIFQVHGDVDARYAPLAVEAAPAAGDELQMSSGADIVARSTRSLNEVLGSLRPALTAIQDALTAVSPDETEVEFGLKFGGEFGVVISKGTAEVNMVVRMRWTRES